MHAAPKRNLAAKTPLADIKNPTTRESTVSKKPKLISYASLSDQFTFHPSVQVPASSERSVSVQQVSASCTPNSTPHFHTLELLHYSRSRIRSNQIHQLLPSRLHPSHTTQQGCTTDGCFIPTHLLGRPYLLYGATLLSQWSRDRNGNYLCNPCAQFLRQHGHDRDPLIARHTPARLQAAINAWTLQRPPPGFNIIVGTADPFPTPAIVLPTAPTPAAPIATLPTPAMAPPAIPAHTAPTPAIPAPTTHAPVAQATASVAPVSATQPSTAQ